MICLDHFWFMSSHLHAHVPPGPGPAPAHHVGHQHHENHPGKSAPHYYGHNVIWTVAAVGWQLKLIGWGWSWAECIKLNLLGCQSWICESFSRSTTGLWNYTIYYIIYSTGWILPPFFNIFLKNFLKWVYVWFSFEIILWHVAIKISNQPEPTWNSFKMQPFAKLSYSYNWTKIGF